MQLPVKSINSSMFFYDKDTRQFYQEVSSLRNCVSLMQPVFDDAIDVGFAIKSVRTGVERIFTLTSEDVKDGEIRGWTFTEMGPRGLPVKDPIQVFITND